MQRLLLAVALVVATLAPTRANADDSPTKQASDHFDRGVSLYGEADYRAALVEFRRAYEIAPNSAVLYNLGQTYYQLQNYALALDAFERYLAESGDSPSHKAEVEGAIKTLKTRVGKLAVTTNLPQSEVTVDDELVGKTPIAAAVSVSVGRRKITALHEGHSPEIRYVDIAAGETSKLSIDFPPTGGALQPNGQPGQPHESRDLSKPLWITAGVVGVVGIGFGVAGYIESRSLSDERNSFPASQSSLDSKSTRVTTFAAIGDIAGAVAIITGGVALYFTLTKHKDKEGHEVQARITPNGFQFAGTF
ncbi:MAG: tetratricopeptide repeat protein [Kofleriaceae bacterium]